MGEKEWLPIYRSVDGKDLYSVCTSGAFLMVDGKIIKLNDYKGFTYSKWAMLCALARKPGEPVSKSELWDAMYGGGHFGNLSDRLKTDKLGLCSILENACPIPDRDVKWKKLIEPCSNGRYNGYKLNLTPAVEACGLPTGGGEHTEGGDETSEVPTSTLILNARIRRKGGEEESGPGGYLNPTPIKIDPCEYEAVGFGHNFKTNGKLTWFGQGTKSGRLSVPIGGEMVSEALGAIGLPEQQQDERATEEKATSPVSRYHCVAAYDWQEQGWRLFDLNSLNGTMIIRKEPEGAETVLIAGLGRENKKVISEIIKKTETEASPLEMAAIQTGAKIGDGDTSYYASGVPIGRGDEICMAFQIKKGEQGIWRLEPRNESCIVEIL